MSNTNEVNTPQQAKKKKRVVVAVVIVVVLACLGIAGWKWHEQPSFCNAVCHQPMDRYVEGYYDPNNTNLIAVHGKQGKGVTCLECHVPTIEQQLTEVEHWVTGNFTDPLAKRQFGNEFCLNEKCHPYTYEELEQATSSMSFNPHSRHHGEQQCSSCHKVHDQSSVLCVQCHQEAQEIVPPSWAKKA